MSEYNCFGHAVGVRKWIIMQSWRDFVADYMDIEEEEIYQDFFEAKLYNVATSDAIVELNERFKLKYTRPDLMKRGKEYVAYKFGVGDFHFALRDKQGNWTHKQGHTNIEPITEEEVFADEWVFGDVYDSETILFEKP